MLDDGVECHWGHLEVVLLKFPPVFSLAPAYQQPWYLAAGSCLLSLLLQLDTHCRCPPRGLTNARPKEMVGPAKSDWYPLKPVGDQPDSPQSDNSTKKLISELWIRVSGCPVFACGHPLYLISKLKTFLHTHTPKTAGENFLKLPSQPYCMLQWLRGYFLICSHFFQSTFVIHPSAQDISGLSKSLHAFF